MEIIQLSRNQTADKLDSPQCKAEKPLAKHRKQTTDKCLAHDVGQLSKWGLIRQHHGRSLPSGNAKGSVPERGKCQLWVPPGGKDNRTSNFRVET